MKVLQGVQSILNGLVGRSQRRITPSADGDQGPPRLDRTNELYVQNLWNSLHALAAEGSLHVAQTATPGTGVTLTSATGTTYSATQGVFAVNNLDTTPSLGGQGRDHIPLWLKLIITAAGTAGTDDHFASVLDQGVRASGGTATLAGRPVSGSFAGQDEASQIIAGVPTLAAATANARNLGRAEGRKAAAPAYIVGDVVTFLFGAVEQVQAQAVTPTTAIGLVLPMPPVIIPPGWSWALLEWMTARSAAQSAEIEYGYVLR
jgi:hypothetical protein